MAKQTDDPHPSRPPFVRVGWSFPKSPNAPALFENERERKRRPRAGCFRAGCVLIGVFWLFFSLPPSPPDSGQTGGWLTQVSRVPTAERRIGKEAAKQRIRASTRKWIFNMGTKEKLLATGTEYDTPRVLTGF